MVFDKMKKTPFNKQHCWRPSIPSKPLAIMVSSLILSACVASQEPDSMPSSSVSSQASVVDPIVASSSNTAISSSSSLINSSASLTSSSAPQNSSNVPVINQPSSSSNSTPASSSLSSISSASTQSSLSVASSLPNTSSEAISSSQPASSSSEAVSSSASSINNERPVVNSSGSDPGAKGAFKTKSERYTLGDTALKVTNIDDRIESTGIIFYPEKTGDAKLPVILMIHGKFDTCYRASEDGADLMFDWPCPRGFKAAPYYLGFNYLAENLASQGFFVVSVSANGVNANDEEAFDDGARSRTDVIAHHLALWRNFSNNGEGRLKGVIKADLKGKLDFKRVGLFGHSRGGEAVVQFLR